MSFDGVLDLTPTWLMLFFHVRVHKVIYFRHSYVAAGVCTVCSQSCTRHSCTLIHLSKGPYHEKHIHYLTFTTVHALRSGKRFAYSELRTRTTRVQSRWLDRPRSASHQRSNHGLRARRHRVTTHTHAIDVFLVKHSQTLLNTIKRCKALQVAS